MLACGDGVRALLLPFDLLISGVKYSLHCHGELASNPEISVVCKNGLMAGNGAHYLPVRTLPSRRAIFIGVFAMNQISLSAVAESYGGTTATMTSLEISELTGSRHDNVKITIERLSDKDVISLPALQEVKIQRERRAESVEVYVFSGPQGRLDSITVVAQLDPAFTAALVKRWDALETGKAKPAMVTAQDQGQSLTDASNSIIQMHGAGVIGKREAAAMYRAAMLSKFHGAGALLAASKPKPAKAMPAPTQASLTGIFAASLWVQPEVRANRPERPVVLLRSPAVN